MLLRRTLQTAAFALLLVPAVTSAQGPGDDRAAARALAREGQAALDHKDFATAEDRFKRADAQAHAPSFALGLARAQVGLGKWIAAHETYERIMRDGVPKGAPPAERKAVDDAQEEILPFEQRIPGVMLVVQGPGAAAVKATMDGKPLPSGAYTAFQLVDPGPHTFRVEAEGFAPVEKSVTIVEHQSEMVTVALDHPIPSSTPDQLAVPPSVVPPKSPPDRPPPVPPHDPRETAGFVLINVGAVGLIAGTITTVFAAERHDLGPTGHALVAAAVMTLVTGAALTTTGFVLYSKPPKREPAKTAWAAPFVGAGQAGITGGF